MLHMHDVPGECNWDCDRQQYTLHSLPLHRPKDVSEFPNLAISAAGFS